jgi:hypothetical protein
VDDKVKIDSIEKRRLYSVAILITQGNNWTLEGNAYFALTEDEAKAKGSAWAKEKYPDANSCFVHACLVTDAINELMRIIIEKSKWGKGLAELSKEVEEMKRVSGLETKAESIFSSPETDKLQ